MGDVLSLARPWALTALVLPLAYLWWVVLAHRPRSIVVGTLALWKDVPRVVVRDGARRRGRPPLAALLVASALALGVLAWSGPRPGRARPVRTWTCLLDTSASMGLAHAGTTRLELALDAARTWLRANAAPEDVVLWRTPDRAPLRLARDERPPETWCSPVRGAGGTPPWAREDAAGTLWITDRSPATPPTRAGLFASGGAAVPGPVAADGRRVVTWDGERLLESAATRTPLVYLRAPRGSRVPAVLERLVDAWCEARAFARVDASSGDTDLVVELVPSAGAVGSEVELARDGWEARGRLAIDEAPVVEGAGELWLAAETGATRARVVTRTPGRVTVNLAELDEPRGDPVPFALSFGRLLDESALPPTGVVALAERMDAGEARAIAARPPGADGAGGEPAASSGDARVEAGLALLAALLGALGALGARGSR